MHKSEYATEKLSNFAVSKDESELINTITI